MSSKPVPKRDPPAPETAEQVVGEISYEVLKRLLFPFLWFYPYDPVVTRVKKSWWWFSSLAVVDVGLFWQPLVAGELIYLIAIPVAHVALLAVLIASMGPGVLGWWPQALTAPQWTPDQATLWKLSVVPIVVGVAKAMRTNYGIGDDELGVPMSRVDQRSDGAGKFPKLDRHVCTLLMGETGSGKSSAVELLAYQFDYGPETATFAHDLKSDFWDYYREKTDLQVEKIAISGGTVTWNLFLEVENERQFHEIARGIMGKGEPGNPFHRGATQVLIGSLIYLYREGLEGDRMADHTDLVKFVSRDRKEVHQVLVENDLPGAASLDPDTNGASVTYLTMKEHVEEIFVGEFAERGEFSLREYIENPDGRVVIVSSKPDEIETTGPIFRLMLDLSIKFGMNSSTKVNYVLDEVDSLPHLYQLSMLAKAGRGEMVRALVGIQTVGQLHESYGQAKSGVIGNCPQGLYFSPGDRESTDLTLSELGEQREIVESTTESESGRDEHRSHSRTQREVERPPITSGELKQFDAGEAVVVTRTDWWIGRVEMLQNVKDKLDQDGVGIGAQFDKESDEPRLPSR